MAGVMLLPGCTGDRAPEPELSPSSAPTASISPVLPTASDTPPPEAPGAIEFEFRRPDPVCPAASALQTLPAPDQQVLVDPSLHEEGDDFLVFCTYAHADSGVRREDAVLVDHVLITSEITLYHRWEDSTYAGSGLYPELPVGSDNLDDWKVAGPISLPEVWWEGCEPAVQCPDGEEPTVQTHARQLNFRGHVGNLEFYGTVSYIAQRLPFDVETRLRRIFRDFALAIMESYVPAG